MTEGIARRAPAPRREDYAVVDGSRGPRRDFRITVGLREGWDAEGRVYDVSEAVRTARAWMSRRVGAHLPALSGMFTRAEVTYAWPRPDGSAGSDREPVAVFTGEAVHAYLGHPPDQDIEVMLNELAIELGADEALQTLMARAVSAEYEILAVPRRSAWTGDFHCTSTDAMRSTPLQARTRLPSRVAIILRTTPPPEGISQV